MSKIALEGQQAEDVLRIVEVVKQSGKIKKGINEVTKAIERSQAKIVVLANDVNPAELVMHIPLLAEEKGVKCVSAGSKEELGAAAGLPVATVAIAVCDEGQAKEDLQKFVSSL